MFSEEQLPPFHQVLGEHGIPNAKSAGTVRAALHPRLVRGAVNISISAVHFVRVERFHGEVLVALGTLEALLVEDGASHDGPGLLGWIHALLATLANVHLLQPTATHRHGLMDTFWARRITRTKGVARRKINVPRKCIGMQNSSGEMLDEIHRSRGMNASRNTCQRLQKYKTTMDTEEGEGGSWGGRTGWGPT